MRPLLAALIGLMLLGFCVVETGTAFIRNPNHAEPLACDDFTERPTERWVKLDGCTLDFDDALLSDGLGAYERLADRKEGLSHTLRATTPVWNSLLIPVKTPLNRAKPARVVFFLADRELLAWVNSFEAASVAERPKILRNTRFLDRLANPGVLVGKTERGAEAEAVQRVMGREAIGGLMVLRPGTPPGIEIPPLVVILGLVGSALLMFGFNRFNRSGHERQTTVWEEATAVDTKDVKLEIGALEALREEERRRRKR